MHRPRIRFTVGMLFFAVALVAMNLWGFRHFYATQRSMGGRIWYRLLPAPVGAIPLVNVALVGACLFAVRRLRSVRNGRAADARFSWSGVVYFSVHILLVGGLTCYLVPDAIVIVQQLVDDLTEHVAEAWAAVLGQPGGTVPWVVFDTFMLGLFISGPPLLLALIGHAIATRCAATLPRYRFRVMAGLVSFGFASIGLAVSVTPQPFEDEHEIDLDFQVVDRVTGRPIASAFLCMTDAFPRDRGSFTPRDFTDADGRARLRGRFIVRGERNAFVTMGDFSPWGRWLEVSAVGHRTRRIALPAVLGDFVDAARPGLGKVGLERGESPEHSFRDLAGIYTAGVWWNGGCAFVIEPDGRFAWSATGCTCHLEEYGYLKRHDREIELESIPHPGREINAEVTCRYRTVEWGDRLYLSTTDEKDLQDFCRQVLTPNGRSRSSQARESYLRHADRDKPQTGLPRLAPKIWVGFLASDLSLKNDEGSLRLALESVLAMIPGQGRAFTVGPEE
jgi:hypothetical protein